MVLKSLKTPLRDIKMVPYSRDILRNGQSTNSHRENPVVLQGILFSFTGISLLAPCSTLYGILAQCGF